MRKFLILPLGMEGSRLRAAVHDPLDLETLDILRLRLGKTIKPVLAPAGGSRAVIDDMFQRRRQRTRSTRRWTRRWTSRWTPVDRSWTSRWTRAGRSIDVSGKSIDMAGSSEDLQNDADPGADHQAGAGDDRRGGPQPGQRHPRRADEGPRARPLPHRRRMRRARQDQAQHEGPDDQPAEDHGRHRHRREATAAGRPHQADRGQAARSTSASARCPATTANRSCCVSCAPTASASASRTWASRRRTTRRSRRSSSGPTASSWSPGRPARARPPRSTARSTS